MKYKLFSIILTFSLITNIRAQGTLNDINIQDLQVPSSPAFVLLDASPTAIERPTSLKAFATSVVSSLNQNNGIPQNYAAEFTPFWFVKHPNMTAFNYWGIDPKTKDQLPFNSFNQYSISLAFVTNKPSDTSNVSKTYVSIGIRSTIIKIMDTKDISDLIAANENWVKQLSDLNMTVHDFDNKIAADNLKIDELPPGSEDKKLVLEKEIELYKLQKQNFINSMDNDQELINCENSVKEILTRKPIFALDGAFATNLSFNGNDFNSSRLGRIGGWLNGVLSLSLDGSNAMVKNNYLNILITARYLNDGNQRNINNSFINQDLFDSGGKLEFELGRLALSYEYLFRSDLSDKAQNSFRSSGMLKYKINDNLYLTSAFGKNFGNQGNLISQLGINLGFDTGNETVTKGQ